MWPAYLTFLLAALTASSLAAPSPLTTSATTVATLSGLQSGNENGILIHVLRTEDLIADKLKSKPLLLEKLSHLLIRVELGNQSVAVNGHSLPMLPGSHPLEVSVKLKEVQMLKMPKDSPLVPLGLTAPEVLNIADKYMSEGIVAALLSVTQEPLIVEAVREDNTPVQAEAYKVTIGIKILEVEGMSLAETDLPAPAASAFATGNMGPAAMLDAALDSTRASLESTLHALSNAMQGMAAHASGMLNGSRPRKPCHKHHHNHHKGAAPKTHAKPIELAAATKALNLISPSAATHSATGWHASPRWLLVHPRRSLVALPFALVFLVFTFIISPSSVVDSTGESSASTIPPAYQAIPVDEKFNDEQQVIVISFKT
ncbi:hypothetical protein PSTT_10706 [Puccinia striiformis]|uniref:Uncharacterized protein n=1 Tax=Puccinia striiformis TaxID=27350 RepID=A0A2S4V3L0_9BASI|nr:hypothetical protein PSTT_10706 [Puccinia striiformis]